MEAKELLQEIKERVFKDTDLSGLASMSDEEKREFLLQQTELLLSSRDKWDIIVWMSEQIIDRQGEVKSDNPLLDYDTLDLKTDIVGLSDEEMVFARFATRLAYFSYCMLNQYGGYFFTNRYLGINAEYDEISRHDEFWITNTALVNWVKTTPYRRVAAGVVAEMISVAGEEAERLNPVEQDYFYGFFGTVAIDQSDIAQCNDYMITGLHTLETAERHRQQAIQLGIDRECATLVDILCGTLINDYPEQKVACAKELQQELQRQIPTLHTEEARLVGPLYPWTGQVLMAFDPVFKKYGIDLHAKEYNISLGYLMDWLELKCMNEMYGAKF